MSGDILPRHQEAGLGNDIVQTEHHISGRRKRVSGIETIPLSPALYDGSARIM
jgi:hypothetical protein